MNHKDSDLLPCEGKALGMSREKIDQQHAADEITPGENRQSPLGACRGPPDEEAAKVSVLGRKKPLVGLRQCSDEHQQDSQAKKKNRQTQRAENVHNAMKPAPPGRTLRIWPGGLAPGCLVFDDCLSAHPTCAVLS